jgi:dTDP-4-dehydrorhamnose 3,5-epimerase
MERIETSLPDVLIIKPKVFADERGFFKETYNREMLASLGIAHTFVQDNHSHSNRDVLRGLHYQLGRPQAKLVRVSSGIVVDVVVDVRRGSPTFSQWIMVELSAENHLMLFAPEGFAHGFLVLSDEADFEYKCSDFWAQPEERGIRWDDPSIGIKWPLDGRKPIISRRDREYPTLDEVPVEDLPVYGQTHP